MPTCKKCGREFRKGERGSLEIPIVCSKGSVLDRVEACPDCAPEIDKWLKKFGLKAKIS